jgi:hypothetical protein
LPTLKLMFVKYVLITLYYQYQHQYQLWIMLFIN